MTTESNYENVEAATKSLKNNEATGMDGLNSIYNTKLNWFNLSILSYRRHWM